MPFYKVHEDNFRETCKTFSLQVLWSHQSIGE